MLVMSKGAITFKGFGDWVEIFRSGTHTDANGKTRTWTHADLDQIVATHSAATPAPLVIGHPTMDAPAYGWSKDLKREGHSLYARFDKVNEAVDKAHQSGAYRNRSIKVAPSSAGWKLVHVGLLGAAPPAVEGLAPVYAANAEGDIYEFGMNDGYWLSQIARGMRRMRDFLIAEFGMEKADRVTPAYEVEDIERKATELLNTPADEPSFSAANPENDVDKKFSQADLDQAIATERAKGEAAIKAAQDDAAKLQFNSRLADNRAFVAGLVTNENGEVRITPAQAEGLPECLTFLQGLDADAGVFAFTAADKSEKKPSAYEFVKAKLTELAPQLRLGREQANTDPAATSAGGQTSIPSGYSADPAKVELDRRARAYMAANNTDYITAVFAVDKSA